MTYNVTIFGIDLILNPIAFTLPIGNGWDIYWYGIIIATGFMLAMVYGYFNAKRFNINTDKMLDVVLVATPCAIIGARAYYLIFDGVKLSSFSEIFGFGGSGFSGLAIYGAVIGALVSGFIMCKIRKVKFLDIADLASVAFLIGQGIGRWGNFLNQEAFGGPTGSDFWGMSSENVVREFIKLGYEPTDLAHPCFLYESVWCLLGALVIFLLSKKRRFSGETSLMYCIWYGFGRAFIELLRTDSLMIGNIKVSFLLSLTISVAAVVVFVVLYARKRKVYKDSTYEQMFSDLDEDVIIEGEE
ncbi:MAG: prolipoprotein diacylglyceryl transferase [Clostridia bacterium]|nr:prolipoprotein diacylglyceryl transferase [Clostridia bacterium]